MTDCLYKIFHTNNNAHQYEYLARFASPSAVHLPIRIRQFNHDKEFQAFFCYNRDLAMLIEKIYSLFNDFNNSLHSTTNIVEQQFALASLIDEVLSTSSIEGIHTTHRQLKDILDGNAGNIHFSAVIKKYALLISGNYSLFSTCKDIRDFYDEFAHADNHANKLDGVLFRKEAVDILSPSGKIIHRGITPEGEIISSLSHALRFLNNDNHPVLVRIAAFHYFFAYIHPFYDGNGRTARFISSAYIAKYLHPIIALRLATTIKRRKSMYYSLLKNSDAEINCGDLTPFICGFLQFIADTILDVTHKLQRKIIQLQHFRLLLSKVIPEKGINFDIMDWLLQASVFYGRGLAMNEIIALSGKSRNTLKNKFLHMPVRQVKAASSRKLFYKIDWAQIRKLYRL